jgi:N-methylhydantoinase A
MGINALLERKGARTALLTTKGFRDIYEIGRINRPDAYNLFFKKHEPLVDRPLRFEVNERMLATGQPLHRPGQDELQKIAEQIEAAGVEALAIVFLNSYVNTEHEVFVKEALARHLPKLYITASHELSQEYREFERTSTTVANAYIGPQVRKYLAETVEVLKEQDFTGKFLIVQSTGGLYDADQASRECIRMLESGPAAGVVATRELCRAMGLTHAVAFDMGGTTAKAGVIVNDSILMSNSVMIGGYNRGLPVQIPMIDIHEVGTGGGSIARVGAGGSLRVGPESAGSKPGPACYGFGGTEITITDANLLLGRISENHFLGGGIKLDRRCAENIMADTVAHPLGLNLHEAADGIIKIACVTMAGVVKRVTTERGLDVRDFSLVSYGGAGPLHAVLIARELGVKQVIIPNAPGHFSAVGMLASDLRRDFVKTYFGRLDEVSFAKIWRMFEGMVEQGQSDIAVAFKGVATETMFALDMRYVGQEHAVTVEIPEALIKDQNRQGIKALFDMEHSRRYGYSAADGKGDIVGLRCAVTGVLSKPVGQTIQEGSRDVKNDALLEHRKIYFGAFGGEVMAPVYRRERLLAGNAVVGPAIIQEHASATVLAAGDEALVDRFGNLSIQIALS